MDAESQVEILLHGHGGNRWRPKRDDPFFGPFLKVDRADYHIHDLQSQINAFLGRHPYVVRAEDSGNGHLSWTVRVTEEVPATFATIIGDAVHNLRDALDLAVAAIPPVRPRNDRWTFFPSADDELAFERAIKKGIEKWAPLKVVGVLRKGVQPYFGGNSSLLRSLSHLAIMDKHYLIAPIVHDVRIHHLVANGKFGPQTIPFMENYSGPVTEGTVLVQTPHPYPGINPGDCAVTSLFVAFDESPARVAFQKVVPTLLAMRNCVEDALVDLRNCIEPPPVS